MEIILLEDIRLLGNLGDIVKVKDGYARNYLIPHKIAKRATKQNLAQVAEQRAALEAKQAELFKLAQSLSDTISAMTVNIKEKAGLDGRLFGSVTSIDILQDLSMQLVNQGMAADLLKRQQIHIPAPIRNVGEHEVNVQLHKDISAKLKVIVAAEA